MGILSSLFAGVSGLNANGTALSVIGNNIANLSTVGFKSSKASFADLISSSISGGSGAIQTGIGVALTSVQGNFSQGSLATSSNVLDIAIDGNGFFVVEDSQGGTFYSRAGLFRLDKNNNVVDPTGFKLQGFLADTSGTITGTIGDISLPTTTASPQATATAFVAANLNSATSPTGVTGNIVGSGASTTTSAGGNNSFNINLNGDGVRTITVANGLTGAPLANAIQNAVRALVPNDPFKAAAYTGFTASVNPANVFSFRSGLTGTTNNLASGTGAVLVTANGGDTLAANLTMTTGTATAGTDFLIGNPTATSDFATSITTFDSLGNSHLLTTYFTKLGDNTWNYNVVASTSDVVTANYDASNIDTSLGIVRVGSGTLTFATDGTLDRESVVTRYDTGTAAGTAGTVPGQLVIDFNGATADQPIVMNFGTSVTTDGGTGLDGTTQFGSNSALVQQTQDGYAAGALQAFSVDSNGVINGRFSNGQLRALAQVVLARFPDPIGLTRTGKNTFAQSGNSGQPVTGTPDSAGLGRVLSNSLELSNVDLGESFIDMIAAQRGFQANSRVITTSDEILQELVNLKR
ncbi:putative flagellar hook protein flgE [Nitrospira sp. KM1]|uniref:flagellar hook protein FlgE n=1 Tax=Nitrospira sp. KM1 TaxID=1936990 RepID=UPI0013A717FF|nr:flagellar hook protein FlgE [Nitrospira sp. KM1]BCA54810.1 putative flagellar hook protein flgE [Nitrospira sp. KM1]